MESSEGAVVLIVEDEPLIMMNAVDILEDAGFQIIEAASADQAIAVLERETSVAAVFTDIQIIGEPDGLMLAHRIRDRWPPMGLVVTSGRIKVRPSELPAGGVFLAKPYASDHLVRLLRTVIHEA